MGRISQAGWWFQPIWKIFIVKMGSSSPNRAENQKWLKPPTSKSPFSLQKKHRIFSSTSIQAVWLTSGKHRDHRLLYNQSKLALEKFHGSWGFLRVSLVIYEIYILRIYGMKLTVRTWTYSNGWMMIFGLLGALLRKLAGAKLLVSRSVRFFH